MTDALTLEPPAARVKNTKRSIRSKGAGRADGAEAPTSPTQKVTAETLAGKQREISVSEFFAKNRHLLGFDNPRKALLTTVKEAVDNSLDACEEAGILPDILVEMQQVKDSAGQPIEDRFKVIVQDNGPGIVRKQIENIFGKLLYGSKFHRLKMSRGQQGIGISAAGMYGLITTGKPILIVSKTSQKKPAHEVLLKMDTSKNRADVVSETEHPEDDALFPEGRGTRVEIELQGRYFKGARSVDEYLELTAIANPHTRFVYISPPTSAQPEGERRVYERSVDELPTQPEEIKPHPHGIELGTLIGMLERTDEKQLGGFFKQEFCRVTPSIAQQICKSVGLSANTSVKQVGHAEAEKLYKALQAAKVMAPPTNCLSPIGVKTILKGLQRGLNPDFIAASSRPPGVYRGRPFVIEAGIAFGGNLPGEDPAQVFRFANRVPLLYQQSACASFKAVSETAWKNYGVQQPRGSLPVGPLVFMIHMASVWVPFTSESKEAIAEYDEIKAEMILALQECGRKLKAYLNRRHRIKQAGERRQIFLRYIGEISKACSEVTGFDAKALYDALMHTAQRKTAEMDQVLDDEGRIVAAEEKLAADEGVYIKEPTETADASVDEPLNLNAAPATEAAVKNKTTKRRGSKVAESASDSTLFGDGEDAPAPASKPRSPRKSRGDDDGDASAPPRKKILVRRKVKRKKS
jgi:DNA topoisomerase-6 subunit B